MRIKVCDNTRVTRANTGLYLHVPFCRSRCSYCDFNTYVGLDPLFDAYARALTREIETTPALVNTDGTAQTIFIGGGTPSLLSPAQIGGLVDASRARFSVAPTAEVTMECNPGTVTPAYFEALRASGVNRLSFGAQSADAGELKLLGREHTFSQVADAIGFARAAGFDNINFDLIYGLPGQQLATWQRTLDAALAIAPNHISMYALSVEQGTPMHDWVRRGEVAAPDPDAAADMFDHAERALASAGFDHYEISYCAGPGANRSTTWCIGATDHTTAWARARTRPSATPAASGGAGGR
jgi:oxygen-independent coproporphyrinogen-3 oxidase